LFEPKGIKWSKWCAEADEANSAVKTKNEARWPQVAMTNPLFGSRIEGSTDINSDNQSLRRGQTTSAVKEFAQGPTCQTFSDNKDVPFAIEGDFTMVKHRFDTRVTKAGGNIELLLESRQSVIGSC
jgi:hypothetical protein